MIEVGLLQAAHLGIEILELGRQTRQLAVALIGVGRHLERGGQRGLESLEAAAVAADLGELVQAPLGVLDLLARREIDRRIERHVDHVLADADEVAPDREIVDGAAVIGGIDDGRRLGGEAGQILGDRQARNVDVGGQERLQGDRRGELAGADQAAGVVIDLLMDRLEEVHRLQEVGHPVERLVVHQDGAEQGLFRLDIVRSHAIGGSRFGRLLARGRIRAVP